MLLLTQLTDDNSLILHDWEEIRIEPNTIGDNSHLGFYHETVRKVLSQPPHGEILEFYNFGLSCKCNGRCNSGECVTRVELSCNGDIAIIENEKFLVAHIDQRYISRIYEAECSNN